MKLLKGLTLALGILMCVVSIGMGAMSNDEQERARYNCFENKDKDACQALIDNGLASVEQCDKSNCASVGRFYRIAGHYRDAIPYYEKAIALGNDSGYAGLATTYYELQDYYNAKKYIEIACNTGNGDLVQAESCYNLWLMYDLGKGVRQDYHKANKLWKKACDMKNGDACNNLGALYYNGQGVRQNLSIAKQYFGKACDLGEQVGCNNYKLLNSQGVQ